MSLPVLVYSVIREKNKLLLRSVAASTLTMMGFGVLYAVSFPGGHPHIEVGLLVGLVLGPLSTVAELTLFQIRGRRLRFRTLLAIRTAFYFILAGATVITVVAYHLTRIWNMSFGDVIRQRDFIDFLKGEFFQVLAYIMVVSLLVNLMREVNRLLGHNALLYFFTGKYHTPVEEKRIFMFLDLKSSTRIAESLGHTAYHEFLNDFFYDITPAVTETRGEIYQYVGDEVVVTWPADAGLRNANCIACYFQARAAIEAARDRYERKYQLVPEFKAGYHVGVVSVAEIGEFKRQIVFHGDTVNTAARIRSECTRAGKPLLLSSVLLTLLPVEGVLTPESVGQIVLSGKSEPMELFSFQEAS